MRSKAAPAACSSRSTSTISSASTIFTAISPATRCCCASPRHPGRQRPRTPAARGPGATRSEEHTSELQSRPHLVCRLLLEKKKQKIVQALHTHKKKNQKKK